MKREYAVVYEWAGKNYSAYVPDLPGCVSTGKTLADVKRNIKEAISGHLKALQEFGQRIEDWGAWQVPTTDTETVPMQSGLNLERGLAHDLSSASEIPPNGARGTKLGRVAAASAAGDSLPSSAVTLVLLPSDE